MNGHTHKPGEWCDQCAIAQDVASAASYDYTTRAWFLDSLSTMRTYADVAPDGVSATFGPVPQGTYWLVDRVSWFSNGTGAAAPARIVTPMGYGIVPRLSQGHVSYEPDVYSLPVPYEVPPGMRLELVWDDPGQPTTDFMSVEIQYRVRTIVPAPAETRKRLFATPVITPDDGGAPVSDTDEPRARPAVVTEFDPTSFKTTDI